MLFQDKKISCRDCGVEFLFTAGEQGFYLEKGLLNDPQRCPGCRSNRRRERAGGREAATVTCASCGSQATVPFVPRLDKPVYCGDCYTTQRAKTPVSV
jgi:CxxC-x17-CxxC domain-containing protein